jgi:hypothetical protein
VTTKASGGRVTLDATRFPYAAAEIEIPLLDFDALEDLDPRDDIRVVVTGRDDQAGTSRTFDLGLRRRPVSHRSRTLSLSLASDEAMLAEKSVLTIDSGAYAHRSNLRDVVDYVLDKIGASLAAGTATYDYTSADPDLFNWKPGVTAWDFLAPLCSTAGLRLFCDENRVWRLISPAEYEVPGLVSLAPWNTIDGTDDITRDDPNVYCTGVVVRYRWRDSAGDQQEAYDSAGDTTGPVLLWDYERPYPGPGAAAAMLSRRTGTGRQQNVTVLAQWNVTPGQEAGITLPGALEQRGQVTAVSWTLTDGLMTVDTRGLADLVPGSIDYLAGTIDALVGTIDSL